MGAQAWPFNYATTGDPAYTAQQLRQLSVAPFVAMGSSGRPLGAKSGIRVGTPSSVATITGSGPYSWNIGGIAGVIDGEANAAAGPYTYSFDTTQTGTIVASGAAARVDRVDVVISDSDEGDGSAAKNVTCEYTQGPATGGGTPTAPARSHRLFLINVPTSGAPTIQWAPDWSGDPGEWTFNTIAERDAYVTLIGSANVPPQQQATIIADPVTGNNAAYYWSGAWRRINSGQNLVIPTSVSGATINTDGSVSFNAVANFAVDGAFITAAPFDHYVIELDQTTTTSNTNLNYQERSGGADNTTTYFWDIIFSASNAVAGANTASTSAIQLTAQTALYRHTTIKVLNPAVAAIRTLVISDDASTDTATAGQSRATGWHGVAAAFDGFKISTTVGAITGKLRIYGISNG